MSAVPKTAQQSDEDTIITGTSADDALKGTTGADRIDGGAGNDTVEAGEGADTLVGDDMTLTGEPVEQGGTGENLIVNGSFELYGAATETTWGDSTTEVDGWTLLEGPAVEIVDSGHGGVAATDGEHWADLEASPGNIVIAQKVDGVEDNQTYTLSFDAANRALNVGMSDRETGSLEVYWNGELIETITPESADFAGYTFEVEGGSGDGSNTLTFKGIGAQDGIGASIDNVSLVPSIGTSHDRLEGESGTDTGLGMQGNDLLVGEQAGEEWSLVDGKWVYDESKLNIGEQPDYSQESQDDYLVGDAGEDVLIGGLGNDQHFGGAGDDVINAGVGRDRADGGEGADQINLEDGDDTAQGGLGADTIHGGAGQDTIYGDLGNVLDNGDYGADPNAGIGFSFLAEEGGWSVGQEQSVDDNNVQTRSIVQNIETEEGETYSLNFDLALGSLASKDAASVEVYWNGELVSTLEPDSALFENFRLDVTGTGGSDTLEFREVISLDDVAESQDVYSTEQQLTVNGETVEVPGFAPGQSNLYQIIDNQLYRFDTDSQSYETVGDAMGTKVNAAGFNPADNLIYGFATQTGTDIHGNAVSKHDLVAVDAAGDVHLIGKVDLASVIGDNNAYIGDFGPDGDLWVMSQGGTPDKMFRVDVDSINAEGEITFETVNLPKEGFPGSIADWAWVEGEQAFVGIAKNGYVVKVDPYNLVDGEGQITSKPITSTVTETGEVEGFPEGSAWGAVFTDAQGNLYAGHNKGDHDMDAATAEQGAIFQITGFDEGDAKAVLLSGAQTTGSNDGASDPRALSSFQPTDGDASVLINNISLTSTSGEDDMITGGTGDDRIFGEGGADDLHGQEGDDTMDGGVGNDAMFGGAGQDDMHGGEGADHVEGNEGDDVLSGNAGDDMVLGGAGKDILSGDAGADRLVGGSGADVIKGGAGDDHMWGGEWGGDNEADLYVFEPGSGQDMIHDFETAKDVIDLSAYGVEWSDVQGSISDQGWATSIELSSLGGESGDRIFLVNVKADDLNKDNFELGS